MRPGLDKLPADMRRRAQWCVAYGDGKPINVRTGELAHTDDPATWATFDEACAHPAPYVGYVLHSSDPYTIIDFDDKPSKPISDETRALHYRVLDALNTYTERSRSGRGYHAICIAEAPYSVRRNSLEIDSTSRFMICTGDVVNPVPPRYAQEVIASIYAELEAAQPRMPGQSIEVAPVQSDADVLQIASNATNGRKFDALYRGDWRELGYPPNATNTGSSEADYALLDMLCFYTPSNEQVRRLFLASALGQRDKAQKNLERNLQKIRSEELPQVDSSELIARVERIRAELTAPPIPLPPVPPPPPVPLPPVPVVPVSPSAGFPQGLVGELADYILTSSVRPVPEIALATAIGLVAGVAGRAFNISGTGLNQYVIVLANTGRGKEETQKGMERIFNTVAARVPLVNDFRGPSNFASGQGLIRTLDKKPCFVSVLGECGLWIQNLCDPNAHQGSQVLKRALLDAYGKSGKHSVMHPTAYSDTEKNTRSVKSPAITLLGESSPAKFYDGLDVESISDGLLPRFTIIEYTGKRLPRNPNAGHPMRPDTAQRVADLVTAAITISASGQTVDIETTPEAQALLDAFDVECDGLINDSLNGVEAELWNRAHLKALKMAGLIAVGMSPHAPKVTEACAVWAIRFIEKDARSLLKRFELGNVGKGEAKQEHCLREMISDFLTAKPREVRAYRVSNEMQRDGIIPLRYIQLRAMKLAAFQTDRRGAGRALRELLDSMQRSGQLVKLAPHSLAAYGLRSEAYTCGEFF